MNGEPDVLQREFRIAQMIWIAILAALVIYAVIGHVLGGREFVDEGSVPLELIRNILIGVSLLILAGSFVIRKRVIAGIGGAAGSSPSVADVAVKFRSATMIAAAFCEAVGLFGLVLVFLGDSLQTLYLFIVAAAAVLVLHRPKMEELQQLARGSGMTM